jgi:proteasome-associated ATPase
VRALEERLLETKTQLSGATMAQNAKLADTLREAREQIVALKEQVEKLAAPAVGYGVFLGAPARRRHRRDLRPGSQAAGQRQPRRRRRRARPGQEVVLNEALNVVEAATSRSSARS